MATNDPTRQAEQNLRAQGNQQPYGQSPTIGSIPEQDINWVKNQLRGGQTPETIQSQMANPPAGREQQHQNTLNALDYVIAGNQQVPTKTQAKEQETDMAFRRRAAELGDKRFEKSLELDRNEAVNSHRIDPTQVNKWDYVFGGDERLTPSEREYVFNKSVEEQAIAANQQRESDQSTFRTGGEVAQDLAVSAGLKAPMVLANSLVGIANQASRTVGAVSNASTRAGAEIVDTLFNDGETEFDLDLTDAIVNAPSLFAGYASQFQEAMEAANSLQSRGLQNARALAQGAIAAQEQESDEWLEAIAVNDENRLMDILGEEAKGFGTAFSEYLERPELIVDTAVESSLMLLGPGAAAQAVRRTGSKISDEAVGALSIGALEGGAGSNEAIANIMNKDTQEVVNSPAGRELKEQGYSDEEVQRIIADRAGTTQYAIGQTVGSIASRLTGVDTRLTKMFNPNTRANTALQVLDRTVGTGIREGAEETIQSGIGSVAGGNVSEAVAMGEDVELDQSLRGAGSEAAVGLLSGAGSGTGMGAVGVALGGVSDIRDATDGLVESKEQFEEVAQGNYENIVDPKNKRYTPEGALKTMLSRELLQNEKMTQPEYRKKYQQKLVEQVNKVTDTQKQRIQEQRKAEKAGNDSEVRRLQRENQKSTRFLQENAPKVKQVLNLLNIQNDDEYRSAVEANQKLNEDGAQITSEEASNVIKYFGSSPESVTPEKLSVLENTEGLQEAQLKRVQQLRQRNQAEQDLTNNLDRRTLESVGSMVLDGNRGKYVGVRQYENNIATNIQAGDQQSAQEQLNSLRDFTQQRAAKANLARRIYDGIQNNNAEVPALQEEFNERFSYESQNQGGAFINERSGRLVQTLEREADLVKASFNNSKGAYEYAFDDQIESPDYEIGLPTSFGDTTQEAPESVSEPVQEEVTQIDEPVEIEATETVEQPIETPTEETVDAPEPVQETQQQEVTEEQESVVSTEEERTAVKSTARDQFNSVIREYGEGSGFNSAEYDRSLDRVVARIQDESTGQEANERITTAAQGFQDELRGLADYGNESTDYKMGIYVARKAGAKFSLGKRLMAKSKSLGNMFNLKPGKQNAFVAVPNVLQNAEQIPAYKELTNDEIKELGTLRNFSEAFTKSLKSLTYSWARNDREGQLNPMSWIKTLRKTENQETETGTAFEQNILDALATLGYEFTGNRITTPFNTDDDIRSLLGLGSDAQITPVMEQNFRYVGKPKDFLVEEIGNQFVSLLGLKPKDYYEQEILDSDGNPTGETERVYISGNSKDKLAFAVGNTVLAVLADSNIIEMQGIGKNVLDYMVENSVDRKTAQQALLSRKESIGALTYFVKPKTTERTVTARSGKQFKKVELTTRTKSLVDSYFNAPELVSKLFSTEPSDSRPTFKPVTKVADFYRKTKQQLPKKVKDIVRTHNARPVNKKSGMNTLFEFLDFEGRQRIYGIENLDEVPADYRENAESKNNQIQRDIELNDQWIQSLELKENPDFYMENIVWRNNRIGLGGSIANMQNSKLARHLFKYADQEVSLNAKQDSNDLTYFKLAVGQHLGVDIDKITIEESLNQFEYIFNDEATQNAIAAINEVSSGQDISEERAIELQETIVEVTESYGENFASLDGLVALASYQNGLQSQSGEFTTDIGIEIDGITNGVIISLLQFGLGNPDETLNMLRSGGIYEQGISTDYSDWKSTPGSLDVYERLALSWYKALGTEYRSMTPEQKKAAGSLANLVGSLTSVDSVGSAAVSSIGRKLAKGPVMTSNYQAGIETIVKTFNEDQVRKILTNIIKEHNKGNLVKVSNMVNDLNNAIGGRLTNQDINVLNNEPRAFSFNPVQLSTLNEALTDIYGASLETALGFEYENLNNGLKEFNKVFSVAFKVWEAFYDKAYSQAQEDLGLQDKDLPEQTQQAVLESTLGYAPIVETFFSESPEEAMLMLKSRREKRTDKDSKITIPFDREINNVFFDRGAGQKSPKSITDHTTGFKYESAGVGPAVRTIHSLDGQTMLRLLEKTGALNIHDAIMVPVTRATESAQTINQELIELMSEYSMPDIMAQTMNKLMDQIENGERLDVTKTNMEVLAPELVSLVASRRDAEAANTLESQMELVNSYSQEVYGKAAEFNYNRNQVMDRIAVVDQYHLTGGAYSMNENIEITEPTQQEFQDITDETSDYFNSNFEGFSQFEPTQVTEIEPTNSMVLFEQLSNIDGNSLNQVHKETLTNVMNELANKALNQVTVAIEEMGPEAIGRYNATNNQIDLKITNPDYNASDKSNAEVYVHEMVHVITHEGLNERPRARGELAKIFTAVRNTAESLDTPSSILWSSNNPTTKEKRNAQELYDYVFNGDGNYLDEFIAHGLTNEGVIRALKRDDVNKELEKTRRTFRLATRSDSAVTQFLVSGFDMVLNIFSDLINAFTDKYFGTRNLAADRRVFALAKHIAKIQDNHTNKLVDALDLTQRITGPLNTKLREWIAGPITDLLGKRKDGKQNLFGKAGNVIGAALDERIDFESWSYAFRETANRMNISKDNIVTSLVREGVGQTFGNFDWYRRLRQSNKKIDQARKHTDTTIQNMLRKGAFTENPSRDESESLTRALFKTDVVSYLVDDSVIRDMTEEQLDEYLSNPTNRNSFRQSMERIRDLIGSKNVRDAEVSRLKDQIRNTYPSELATYYINQAEHLGVFSATGNVTIIDGVTNAHQAAYAVGRTINLSGDTVLAEQLIDKLSTVVALNNTDDTDLQNTYNVLQREVRNGKTIDNNGVSLVINMYAQFKHESLNKLFDGNPMLTVKGYIREITNPHVSIAFASQETDKSRLREAGYRYIKTVGKDPVDPNSGTVDLFVNPVGGLNTYSKSIISTTNMKARGTTLAQGLMLDGDDAAPIHAMGDVQRIKRINDRRVQQGNISPDGIKLLPIRNEAGDIIDYRYVMNEQNRRELLDRNDDFASVLGGMFGNIIDKTNTEEVNNETMDGLKKVFDEEYLNDPNSFIEVSPLSGDEDGREVWALLPESTRQHIRRTWDQDAIYVKKGDFRLVFGFRKWSISEVGKKSFQNTNRQGLKLAGSYITKQLNRPGVRITENVLMELVRMVKDTIVVKSGAVLVANMLSNSIVLRTEGVPISKVAKYQTEGWKFATEFKNNQNEIDTLTLDIKSNRRMSAQERNRKNRRIAQLEKEQSINPVKDLIDEGIFQTIVEDIEVDDERYTYKSKLDELVEPITSLVPRAVKDAGNTIFITHDTRLYRALLDATQLSDFVARYTLHKHNMETSDMTYDESIKRIVDTFVDYDAPTHKAIQYMNDIGLMMFTKFFIRIQKVIARQFKENPGNVLTLLLLQEFMGTDTPDIFDTLISPDNLSNRSMNPITSITDLASPHLFNLSPK